MIFGIKKIYYKQAFNPDFFGLFVNPFYFARLGLLKKVTFYSKYMRGGELIDIGCGSMPYKKLFKVNKFLGLDIDSEDSRIRGIADFYYNGKTFPLQPNSFDHCLCNQVLEHVFNPEEFLGEIHRILKPNGKFLLTVPFVWDEHEQPYDYARYTSFGLKSLLEKNGFKILQHEKIGADATVIFQLINTYIFKLFIKRNKLARFIGMIFFMAPINLLGLILSKLIPKNPDLYLDQIILAKKIS
jgi:SAM-dependent methyltransferase